MFPVIGILVVFFSSLFFKASTNFFLDEKESFFFLILIYAIYGLANLITFNKSSSDKISLTWIDMTAIAVLFTTLLSILSSKHVSVYNEALLLFISISLVYIFTRGADYGKNSSRVLVWGLASTYIFQITCAYINWSGNNFLIDDGMGVVGLFYNSGPFSIFTIALLPFPIYILNEQKSRYLKYLGIGTLFTVTFCVILLTQSRTSIVCLVAVGLYMLISINSKAKSLITKRWVILSTVTIVILGITSLTFLKLDSSIGRLLIWKVSIINFLANPILGYGYGSFAKLYPTWQATYFQQYPDDIGHFKVVADVSYVAFNEFLQILLESGILGIISWCYFFFSIFRTNTNGDNSNHKLLTAIRGSVLAIITSGFFSYPLHTAPIMVLLAINSGLVSAFQSKGFVFSFPRAFQHLTKVVVVAGCLFMTTYLGRYYLEILDWHTVKLKALQSDSGVLKQYESLYSHLKTNSVFLSNYGETLYYYQNYSKAVVIFNESQANYITEKNCVLLGQAYLKLKLYGQAQRTFGNLSSMLPNRFVPRHQLMKIALLKNDTLQAKIIAKQIINMPVKIPSETVSGIKMEMKEFLKNNR
ncbi:O-antigen ligase family protein [Daejeonella lutea]|uniref:O-antigen ligase n=1 Tax=Daejeonella lutea TaxID=572036 RepID=A0A1T5B280_9SPHI|nr:O-antigen ligase family protein [Daejeonella lutea]SKB41209.1 O-antigen ligase [Daejeonella lutea]